MVKKIGLIGYGAIGRYLHRRIEADESMTVCFVHDADDSATASLPSRLVARNVEEMSARGADLVVEAAHPDAVRSLGMTLLKGADLLPFSLTALSDDDLRGRLTARAREAGKKIFIPHGALLGIDGIHDGRRVIERIEITTTKHPRSLGLDGASIAAPTIVYAGSTRGACRRFPRNVNTHAAVALAGIGFDRTLATIIADPQTRTMAHVIEVWGNGLHWKIAIESRPVGTVTGTYTPESAYGTIQRLCGRQAGLHLV